MQTVTMAADTANFQTYANSIHKPYLQAVELIERLHRRLLDLIKDEFGRRGRTEINPVQALLLYNIGDKELSVGHLRSHGYYLGTNVSYNVKKLADIGLLEHRSSDLDRRSVQIKLTAKGREVCEIVEAVYSKHAWTIEHLGSIGDVEFATLNKLLHRLERFWTDQVVYRM
jgi:DNA-binding MarR family transcriptional regulator